MVAFDSLDSVVDREVGVGALIVERVEIPLDDDVLNHVFVVLVAKLRRHETTTLTWLDASGCRERVFIGTQTAIEARFDEAEPCGLDRDWLDRLMVAANSISGISLAATEAHRHDDVIPSDTPPRVSAGGPSSPRDRPGRVGPAHV